MKYFLYSEFSCRCGCGENKMDEGFLKKLDELREICGFPFIITSGYRCPKHNLQVATSGEHGPHTTGRAVDIRVDRERAYLLLKAALIRGFTGIGIQQKGGGRYLHLDDLPNDINQPRPTVWSY